MTSGKARAGSHASFHVSFLTNTLTVLRPPMTDAMDATTGYSTSGMLRIIYNPKLVSPVVGDACQFDDQPVPVDGLVDFSENFTSPLRCPHRHLFSFVITFVSKVVHNAVNVCETVPH